MANNLLTTLRYLEELLHTDTVRRNPEKLEALLHPEFAEVGRSGTRYSRAQIIASLQEESPLPTIHASDYALAQLADDVALLTYTSAHVDEAGGRYRETYRSSIWVRNGRTWQMRFHQGTPKAAK